ncbi:cytochrome b5 domain-containing protein [Proteiniclasticum sp.]|uniref:cytochrome b5 domain-containing protein n=1 Tax=Proteiniclasticum sp. TaxID=2053595 RepID=UPI0028975F2E|nr:cytochrome b5 domain-containing protein [Proteiniclasticum sp.]
MITKKIIGGILASVMSVALLVGCGTDNETPDSPAETPMETPANEGGGVGEEGLELTLEELAEFDGQNGNKAYIAVDGKVYDVTDLPPWEGGEHNDYPAGQDYTEKIKDVAPHGLTPLESLEPVGTIVD